MRQHLLSLQGAYENVMNLNVVYLEAWSNCIRMDGWVKLFVLGSFWFRFVQFGSHQFVFCSSGQYSSFDHIVEVKYVHFQLEVFMYW